MIELEGVPELVDPVMVAAFEGWNDAGDAASAAVGHLEREWKGEVFAALDAEDYYDFQVNRPQVWLDGGVRKITWPTTRLAVVRVSDADGKGNPRDLVLVRGIEPSMRWRSFCNEILGFAHELGVEMVVAMGALLGDTPHTRPVPVTGVTSDPDLARTMHLEESKYEGPTGIVGILQEACTHAGVPAVSLWAAVPHYVSQPPNPKATLALLNRLEDLLGMRFPMGDLPEDARAWQLGVDQLAQEDSEVAEYVQALEEARDTAELPEASGEAIAKEFERYLQRRGDGPGDSAPPYFRDRGGSPGTAHPHSPKRPPEPPEQTDGPEGGSSAAEFTGTAGQTAAGDGPEESTGSPAGEDSNGTEAGGSEQQQAPEGDGSHQPDQAGELDTEPEEPGTAEHPGEQKPDNDTGADDDTGTGSGPGSDNDTGTTGSDRNPGDSGTSPDEHS